MNSEVRKVYYWALKALGRSRICAQQYNGLNEFVILYYRGAYLGTLVPKERQ